LIFSEVVVGAQVSLVRGTLFFRSRLVMNDSGAGGPGLPEATRAVALGDEVCAGGSSRGSREGADRGHAVEFTTEGKARGAADQ